MALQLGDSLGRYRLEELVGQGGMAVVYGATDTVLGRTVAVKVIRPAFTGDQQFLERFLQEARLVASLDHPNVLPVYDFGEHDGSPFLVLPYLRGGTLAARLERRPQPLAQVAAWLMQLAGALDAAHARGVLHRDVKPGNVLVGNDGRLVLGDFGIARLAEASTRLTATGTVVGTPLYMAPELARGADATPASDRYALAVMAYEMVAGQPPFVGANPLSILHQQVNDPVPPVAPRLPELPPAVDHWLQRGLAKDPAARPASSRAFAEELVALLTPEQRSALSTLVWTGGSGLRPLAPGDAPTIPTPSTSAAGAGGSSPLAAPAAAEPGATAAARTRRQTASGTAATPLATPLRTGARSRAAWWLVGAVAAAAVAVAALGWWGPGRDRGAPPPAGEAAGQAPAAASGDSSSTTASTAAAPAPAPAQGAPAAVAPAAAAAVPGGPPPASPGAVTGGTAAEGAAAAADSAVGERPAPAAAAPAEDPASHPAAAALADSRAAASWLRRPSRRLDPAIFAAVEKAASERGADTLLAPLVPVAREWALGGAAYAGGRDDEAERHRRNVVARAAAAGTTTPWGIAWPALVFQHADGELARAALYGDSRAQLGALAAEAAAGGARLQAALATAYVRHLEGQHAAAARALGEAGVDPRELPDERLRALVAQLLMAEAIEVGDGDAARRWQPLAATGETTPLVTTFLWEMAPLAKRTLPPEDAEAVRALGCRVGVRHLCADRLPQAGGRPRLRQPRRPPDGGR